jgi:hypothetical protein
MNEPVDKKLYEKVKKEIYRQQPEHSAYRSGKLVKEYKAQFTQKHGNHMKPYKGTKTKKRGLARWFAEKWMNQRGEIGYKHKNDVYRPSIRITKKTPKTFGELTKKQIKRARSEKYRKGRVYRFKPE